MSAFENEGWELRETSAGSEEYRQLLDLRFAELRKPLELTWTKEELEADQGDRHFGLYLAGDLVGTCVARELGDGVVKLRQIAVNAERQGEGLGLLLMARVEERLAAEGMSRCELNARLTVVGFYERAGYAGVGDLFEEIGMPHFKMRKLIRSGGSA